MSREETDCIDRISKGLSCLRACERLNHSNPELIAGGIEELVNDVRKLLSEHDNPVPDGMYRKVLRDRLKATLTRMGLL